MNRPITKKETPLSGPGEGEGAAKRDSILAAAASLFAGRDISLVTMEEVAARAHVAKGTLYNHFSSKEDLYFSILTARMRHLCGAIRGILAEELDVGLGLRKYVVHTMMFLLKYPDFFRLLRKEGACPRSTAPVEVHDMRMELRGILRSVLSRGMEDGSFRPVPLDLATDVLLGAIEGAALRCIEDGCEPQPGLPEAESVFDLLWASLVAEPAVGGLSEARVLITREEGSEGALGAEIAKLGGTAMPFPLLRTVPLDDVTPLRDAVARAADYDWILFTSARGVEAFCRAGGTGDACGGAKIGAVGRGTAQRARDSIGRCDLVTESQNGVGLAAALRDVSGGLAGRRVLLPRATEARPDLPRILRSEGAQVDEVSAYRTIPADVDAQPIARALSRGEIDAIAFTSGSAVRAFVEKLGDVVAVREERPRVISIGPSTTGTLREFGIEPDEEAASPSWPEMAQAVLRAVRRMRRVEMTGPEKDAPGRVGGDSGR